MGIIKYYRFSLWVIVISILCFTPGSEFRAVKINIPHFDKIIHFLMFYILGLFLRGIQNINSNTSTVLVSSSILYAAAIEIIQHYFIPMRSGDFFDLLADIVGLLIGIATYFYYPTFIKQFIKG